MSNDINALIRPKKELLDNLDKVALAKLEKEKKEYSNTIELYKRYQNNIKLSKGLLSEILQETEKGEDICNLFFKDAPSAGEGTLNFALTPGCVMPRR